MNFFTFPRCLCYRSSFPFIILTIRFLTKYFNRPMHFFGRLGLLGTLLGGGIPGCLAIYKVTGQHLLWQHGPLIIASRTVPTAGLFR